MCMPLFGRYDSGSTVPIALMEALVSPGKLGLREQTVVYGMTETSPVTFGCGEYGGHAEDG
jgi:hypothetical protein